MNFNLSRRKSIRISGVSDFVGGYVGKTLDELPPQDELNMNHISYIRDMSLSSNRSNFRESEKIKYYVRYPKYFFYHFYDLEKYFAYYGRDDIFEKAWDIYLNTPGNSFYIPSQMSERCVKEVLDTNKISSSTAADFFISQKQCKDDQPFLKIVADKFPEEYKRVFGNDSSYIYSDLKNFLENPSEENKGKLKSSLQSFNGNDPDEIDLIKKIKVHFIKNCNFYNDWKPKNQKRSYYSDGSSLLSCVNEAIESIQKKESLDDSDNPFTIRFIEDQLIGDVVAVYYNDDIISKSALSILRDNISSDKYYEISTPYRRDYSELDLDENTIYLIEDGVLATAISQKTGLSFDFNLMKELDKLYFVNPKMNSSFMVEYVKDLFATKPPEVAFNSLMKNELFKSFMSQANDDFWGAYVNNYEILSEDSTTRDFSTVFPFNMGSAFEIWKIIPEKFRHIQEYGFFYMCSGFFPCSEIYERAKSDLKHTILYVDHILGSCSEDDNKKLRKQIIFDHENIKRVSRYTFDEGIKDFLSSSAVKKKALSDFPNLQKNCVEFLQRNLTNEEVYDYGSMGMVSSVDKAIASISRTPIYLINSEAMTIKFSDDVLRYLKFSPNECNGFFSDYFAGDKAIVVYVDQVGGEINKVLGEIIGLNYYSEDSSLNVESEATLWHEMAHALSAEVIRGPIEKQDTIAEWMSSTDEILAMSYGNLQYIKNKLRGFFKEQFPFNKKIESGFVNEIKSGVINSFPMEFSGSSKEEALNSILSSVPDFEDDVLEMLNNMSKEEKIDYLVNMFTEFFMGKFLRGKVEEHFFGQKSEEEKLTFKEKKVIPEEDKPFVAYQRDEFVKELQIREDYQKFIELSREYVKKNYMYDDRLKRFTNRIYKNSLITPTTLSQVLMMVFDLKGSVSTTDINNQGIFYDIAPSSLINYLKDIVKQEAEIANRRFTEPPPEPQVPSPEEAEESGRFIAEQDEEYGPDWMWLANGSSWYKKSKVHNLGLFKKSNDYMLYDSTSDIKTDKIKSDWYNESKVDNYLRLVKKSSGHITLYHGTSHTNAEKIKSEGLRHNNLGPGWYTLADNFEDAKDHSYVGDDESVVIEFRVPKISEGSGKLNPWIWNETEAGSGHWYALRKDLPSSFVERIHKVEKGS